MKNYIFVHGAWHGKWAFDKIIPKLKKSINVASVVALDLPGHYDNFNTHSFCDIRLKSYVNFVSDFIKSNNLYNSYLVGHSMGGVVISQVGQDIPQYIDKLIYISAFIPNNNGSLVEEEQKANCPSIALHININTDNCSISINKKVVKDIFYQHCAESDINLALSKIQDQPLLPFIEKVSLGDNFNQLYKVYIECLKDKAINIEEQRRMNNICNKIISIDTDHSPFFSSPDELVSILDKENNHDI
ncbi:MAG: alpha/beta fold hydrolase [Rickettsiaceae bacterium]|nr:alpha/beta fold hydrolase [Rickettsiaceae bacterium]